MSNNHGETQRIRTSHIDQLITQKQLQTITTCSRVIAVALTHPLYRYRCLIQGWPSLYRGGRLRGVTGPLSVADIREAFYETPFNAWSMYNGACIAVVKHLFRLVFVGGGSNNVFSAQQTSPSLSLSSPSAENTDHEESEEQRERCDEADDNDEICSTKATHTGFGFAQKAVDYCLHRLTLLHCYIVTPFWGVMESWKKGSNRIQRHVRGLLIFLTEEILQYPMFALHALFTVDTKVKTCPGPFYGVRRYTAPIRLYNPELLELKGAKLRTFLRLVQACCDGVTSCPFSFGVGTFAQGAAALCKELDRIRRGYRSRPVSVRRTVYAGFSAHLIGRLVSMMVYRLVTSSTISQIEKERLSALSTSRSGERIKRELNEFRQNLAVPTKTAAAGGRDDDQKKPQQQTTNDNNRSISEKTKLLHRHLLRYCDTRLFLMRCVAGVLAVAASYPFDTLRRRRVTTSWDTPNTHKSTFFGPWALCKEILTDYQQFGHPLVSLFAGVQYAVLRSLLVDCCEELILLSFTNLFMNRPSAPFC